MTELMATMIEHDHTSEVADKLRADLSSKYRALNQGIGDRLRKL